MMDCDLQHPPALITPLLARCEEDYGILHTIRRFDRQTGPLRRATPRMFYRLRNVLSPVELREGAADFLLISLRIIGEHIGSTFDDVKRRDMYVADEVIHNNTLVALPCVKPVQSKIV